MAMKILIRDSACPPVIGQSIKLFYIIVVVPAFIITIQTEICNAQITLCNSFNYTGDTVFESNLNTVLNSLVEDRSQTGYNTSVYGESPDKIYGFLQCLGNTTVDQCYTCSKNAVTTIRQRRSQGCGNAVGGRIWSDFCYLRYENYSFIGQLDTYGWFIYNLNNVSSPEIFSTALRSLFRNLSAEAAYVPSRNGYASGTTVDDPSQKIYAQVQCTRDISSDNCTECLSQTTTSIFSRYYGRKGAQGLLGCCMVRYETYDFFNSADLPPPPAEAPASTPSPSDSGTSTSTSIDMPIADCNYDTTGNAFESNLDTVLNRLVENTSQTRFNTSEYGQSPDQIYGLLQCRGDTTVQQCHKCSQDAVTTIRKSCGMVGGGRIWFDFCFLRYENYDFIGKLNISGHYPPPYPQNVPNSTDFNAALDVLFNKLLSKIESGSKYATDATKDSFSRNIYGLVQCTRDISMDDCTKCLKQTKNHLLTYYVGKQGAQGLMRSCIVRYDIDSFFSSTAPPPALPSSNRTQINESSNKIALISGVVGCSLLVLIVCLFAAGKGFKSTIFRRGYEVHEQLVDEDTLIFNEDSQIVTFGMETLVAATENFRDDNKLGEGGFGPVYKGTTQDGKEIAVKKLSLNSVQGKKEFLNEVNLLAKIQHRNLVKLLGCCAEGLQRLLVYEYLPNNSLDKILFDPIKRKQLDWQKRYNIILGVARGLLYLHQDSHPRIIHRDIKASNILLDDKLNPKIADFGLAKLFPEDESYVNTRLAGTFGYMAPEYAVQGQLTVKADVYSFGVLLLEVVTGRKNMDYNLSPDMQILLGWAWRSYELGNIMQIIDPQAIIETCDEEQASRFIQVGLLCTQAEASLRPPMSTATLMLSSDSMTLPHPTKPFFVSSITQITPPTGYSCGSSHASAFTTSTSSLTPADPASIADLVPR